MSGMVGKGRGKKCGEEGITEDMAEGQITMAKLKD